jgi:hypothetical protein
MYLLIPGPARRPSDARDPVQQVGPGEFFTARPISFVNNSLWRGDGWVVGWSREAPACCSGGA